MPERYFAALNESRVDGPTDDEHIDRLVNESGPDIPALEKKRDPMIEQAVKRELRRTPRSQGIQQEGPLIFPSK